MRTPKQYAPNQALHSDRGHIRVSRDTTSFLAVRQVNAVVHRFQNKRLFMASPNSDYPDITGSIAAMIGFSGWTIYLCRDGFTWWAVPTGVIALLMGLTALISYGESKKQGKSSDNAGSGSRSVDAWVNEQVDQLVSIYRQHKGFVKGSGGAPEQKVRSIGEELNRRGGMDLMLAAHEKFSHRCSVPGAARNLEHVWDMIGSWQG